MIDYLLSNLWALWACVSVVCLMMELTSGDCFLLCIAIGSAVTALVAALGGGIYVQLIVASIVSLFCLFAIRPKLLKKLHEGEDKRVSNADAVVNKVGEVTEDIPANGFGRVAAGGDDWKAKTADGSALAKGQRVKVTVLESIIVTVEKI
ncbi:MAG: NfeD family protein [Bacteroidaceae bacterium]|nr:NfeD family protein [Bacteroidaceae bacterium]